MRVDKQKENEGGLGMEDGALVELYWARDERAIGETEKKYGPYCRSIAYGILQNREDTEETVNDT
ncbi:MAG: hypothetical protein ACI4PC_05385 [Oscillospiraceae bacterium]